MKILRTITVRLLTLVPTLLGLVTIMFFVTYYLPADPIGLAAGLTATPEQRERIRERYGFDKPIYIQYMYYVQRVIFKADFGTSIYSQRRVSDDILARLPATLELALFALVLGIIMGVVLGVYSAMHRNKYRDNIIRGLSIGAISLAPFWIAIELQLIFSYRFGLLPLIGRIGRDVELQTITGFYLLDSILTLNGAAFISSLEHLLLPAATLALVPLGIITRFSRAGILQVMQNDYILYEKGMGISRRLLVWKYALKNSLVGTVAQIGLLFGFVLASTFVIEKIFMWPGIGAYALESIIMLDYKAVLGISLWAGIVYSLGGLCADVLLVLIDPREVGK